MKPPMSDLKRPVSLDQFRRKREDPVGGADATLSPPPIVSTSSVAFPKPAMPTISLRTRRRLDAASMAVDRLKMAELATIAAVEAPTRYRIRFSAAAVAREAGIGRTQLYEGDSAVQTAIELARAELEAALEQRRSARRPRSKRMMEIQLADMKVRHEADLSRLASKSMADIISRMGPVLDACQRVSNGDAEAQARIRQLEQELKAQVAANQVFLNWMSTATEEQRGGKGRARLSEKARTLQTLFRQIEFWL